MNKSRLFIIVLLAIILIAPSIPIGMADGYGEENESLGQFVDDFENDDNVSVAVSVINNQTLDCMELNYTSELGTKEYENFTLYVEADPVGDRIVFLSDFNVSLNYIRNVDTRLYEDYGVAFFDTFEWEYEMFFTSDIASSAKIWFMLSNYTTNAFTQLSNNRRYLTCIMTEVGGNQQIDVIEGKSDGTQNKQSSGDLDIDTWYYNKFKLNITHWELSIYSNRARTTLVETISLTLAETKANYRYLLLSSLNSGHAIGMTGYIRNIWLGNVTGGYEENGYFITEDYLNYTIGQSLTLLTNASLPISTSITTELSQDNSTWTDNKGNVGGSNNILDGFYALDLRDLNYTDIFIRYNFTGIAESTPRLYQSRLITTEGMAGECPPGYDYSIIFLAIGLILMLSIAFLYTRDK